MLGMFIEPAMGVADMLAYILGGGGEGGTIAGNGSTGNGTGASTYAANVAAQQAQVAADAAAAAARSGTTSIKPTFVGEQQIVAAATHTTATVTHPLTAQQRGLPTGMGYGSSSVGGAGRGTAPAGTGSPTTEEQSGGGATYTSAGGGRGARRAV